MNNRQCSRWKNKTRESPTTKWWEVCPEKGLPNLKKAIAIRPCQGRGALPPTLLPVPPAVIHFGAFQAFAFLTTLSFNLIEPFGIR